MTGTADLQVTLYLSVPDDRPLEDAVHAKDGGLGRVDDRSSEQGTKYAPIARERIDTGCSENISRFEV